MERKTMIKNFDKIHTLEDLKNSDFQTTSIKEEMRKNLIEILRTKKIRLNKLSVMMILYFPKFKLLFYRDIILFFSVYADRQKLK